MIKEVNNQADWDKFVTTHSGHPLQLWGWGELKSMHGWDAHRVTLEQGNYASGAQILTKQLPIIGKSIAYIPRGPIGQSEKLLRELADYAKASLNAIVLTVEPDWTEMNAWPRGWRTSKNRILVPRTSMLNLKKTEDELLADMTKKTRQYIRKSENSGIATRRVITENDIMKCLSIYRSTAEQRKFGIHDEAYYYDLAKLAGDNNLIYLAEKEGQPLSFLWNLRTPACEFELYGGANEAGQAARSNYILKWQAITAARTAGVGLYDMNGLLNDGISTFKRGFVNAETNFVGVWDKPLSPLYYIWEAILPIAKHTARAISKIRGRS